jgi:trigger factor
VKTSVDFLEGNRVRLTVEVDEAEFNQAVDAAFRKIGREVRIPGFRPGKAPRRLLEARVGTQVARQEALRDALPGYYQRALDEHDIQPIAPPELEITGGREEGPVSFDAVVEIMPRVGVAGYDGLRVVLPSVEVTEEEVDRQVDRLRDQFGQLQAVDRPARDGDHVSIDRRLTRHDETLHAVEDELYEVGTGSVAPALDEELRGKRAGDILRFNAEVPEFGEVTMHVLVKEVREKVLPEPDDDWASEASEFDTVEELRADIRRRMDAIKRLQAAMAMHDKILEALVELVDEPLPEALVAAEVENRLENLEHRLGHQGADIPTYLQATGMSQQQLLANLHAEAESVLKADLALAAVAEMEGLEVTDDDVEAEILRLAERRGEKPATVRRRLHDEGELPAVRSGIRRTKAMEWLVAHTEYVDEDGRVIDREQLEPSRSGSDDEPSPEAEETDQ